MPVAEGQRRAGGRRREKQMSERGHDEVVVSGALRLVRL
jgi:hypothetical protein